MTKLLHIDKVVRDEKTVLTVGTFDGVHEGHKSLIRKLVEHSRELCCRSVLVTFDPHPREIISGGKNTIHLLTTLDERREMVAILGIDEMVVIPFTRDFSLLSSEEFIKEYIYSRIGIQEFVIGYDHQFGKNREGSIETLKASGKELGFAVDVVEAHQMEAVTVSSTQVRNALKEEGDVDLAHTFLGRPYRLEATVIHGHGRGKIIGYPTANLRLKHVKKIIPQVGVYVVDVLMGGRRFRGMMNIGFRPTFLTGSELALEINLLDFDSDIYGYDIVVEFLHRIRGEEKFETKEALIERLKKDKVIAQSW